MITWLASYPKSGNTWLRILLEALTGESDQPVSINAIERVNGHASNRLLFDAHVGVRSADLPRALIDQLRPKVYAAALHATPSPRYLKVHDAWNLAAADAPMFPQAVTRAVLYVVRNPLDVAISLRHHLVIDQDAAIRFMANENATLAASTRKLPEQLPQRLHSWSTHVSSWLDSPLPVHLVRYEDLKSAAVSTLRAVAEFLGLPATQPRLQAAIEAASFDRLRQQEQSTGFRERNPRVGVFFRRGEAGTWREELDTQQVERILADHGAMMRRLGYLDATGAPL